MKEQKEKVKLEEEGYKKEDIEKILMGADKKDFKAEKPETDDMGLGF